MRKEYKLSELKGGVRGKYAARLKASSNIVVLEPELARVFPNSEAVNSALKLLVSAASRSLPRHRRGKTGAA
jgi:hypothetical protein